MCQKYKASVINHFINRAFKITTNWQDFHNEINHVKQMLANSNYSDTIINKVIARFLDKNINLKEVINKKQHRLSYKN